MASVLADDLDASGGRVFDNRLIGQVRRVRSAYQCGLNLLSDRIGEIAGPPVLLRALAHRGLVHAVLACDLPNRELSRAILALDGLPIRCILRLGGRFLLLVACLLPEWFGVTHFLIRSVSMHP